MTLGRWPEIGLKQARQLARQKRKAAGLEAPNGYVFRDAFRIWCDLKKDRIVSYKSERKMLERHLLPAIGSRQLDEITAPTIINALKPVHASGKQVTLKRLVMRCREILDIAVCAGYVRHNPIERLSRIYAPPVVEPMPSIRWQDLESAMQIISSSHRKIQVLFLWSLCSMLRPGETAQLKWAWIDNGVLTVPAESMKNGLPHRVPLTDEMRRLLDEAKRISRHQRSAYVFPGRTGAKPMSSQTMAKHLHSTELKGRLVAHGIRSIGRSWMADHEMPYEAAEACLSHLTGSAVSRAYQRSDYLDLRRQIMSQWCAYVFACAGKAGIALP